MDRRTLLWTGMGGLGLGCWPSLSRAQLPPQGRSVQLGVLPITSTRVLLGNYAPVQAYLQRVLDQPVELVTAPDFRTFHQRTLQGQYDLVVTATHLGRLAQLEAGWVPLVRYTAVHRTMLIAASARPLARVEELRGGVLAGPDAVTLAAVDSHDWLQARGLLAGVDYTYLETPTPSSAAHALLNGQSSLAVTSPQGLNNTPEALRKQITVFASLQELPSLLWLAHSRLAIHEAQLRSALLGLNAPAAGVAGFFAATGYQAVREIPVDEFGAADRYLTRLREALKTAR